MHVAHSLAVPARRVAWSVHNLKLLWWCCTCSSACNNLHYVLQVKEDALYDAFYRLTNTNGQITSYVFDVVGTASVIMVFGPREASCTVQKVDTIACMLCLSRYPICVYGEYLLELPLLLVAGPRHCAQHPAG